MKREIGEMVKKEGLMGDVELMEEKKEGMMGIFVKYGGNKEGVIRGLKRMRKGGVGV
ncbi:30S ribosomal protein S8 [Siminovitchia fortis]|uniref:30S ribosomal protein S8 n=1 Tax=Siminovitchia fortis TaxID=254758 RepID=UPI0021B24BC3|nr:30S ribosomal protein S8 [Siminovitchia fortis]